MLNAKPSCALGIVDQVTEKSILDEIRHAVKKAIIQTGGTDIGFGDIDFVVDDFVSIDLPDAEYERLQEACDDIAFAEFHRIMGHLRAAFNPVSRGDGPVRVK
jgi:hypothetical protein